MLQHEVCLFVLKTARESSCTPTQQHLTALFLAHDDRWFNRQLARNFIRFRLFDMDTFDHCLSNSLSSISFAVSAFAADLVGRCTEDGLLQPSDLHQTISKLRTTFPDTCDCDSEEDEPIDASSIVSFY